MLLVDDERQILDLYKVLLEDRFAVDTAGSAEEGLRACRESGPYPVIVSDQHMPSGLKGLEFLARVRKESPDSICLLLTGHASLDEAIAAVNSGVVFRFLTKPCSRDSLVQCIDAGLAQHRLVRVEKRRLEQLVASIPSILIGISEEDRIIQWNESAERTFGLTAADVLDELIGTLAIPWDASTVLRAVEDCRAKGPLRLNDSPYTRADGNQGLLGLSLTQFASTEATSPGVLIVGADITERRQLESQHGHAQKLEAIGRLSAGIAHEINTPTQYVGDNTRFLRDAFAEILGLLEKISALTRLRDTGRLPAALFEEVRSAMAAVDLDYLTGEIPRAIQESLDGVERTAKIVGAMKEFSHPAETKMPADLNRGIESTVTVARNEWKYVAELVLDLDPELKPVPCLPGEINQVILNLIVNAAHAIEEVGGEGSAKKGTIAISTRQTGRWAEIRVADTGAGIPKGIRHRIFDPFFTTKEVGKGTGQGLSIAHAVVAQKHGGTIAVESEVGVGTTFIIRLPMEATSAERAQREERFAVREQPEMPVVDDSSGVQRGFGSYELEPVVRNQ